MKLPETTTNGSVCDDTHCRDFYLCNGSEPDDIVITGISSRLPKCNNLNEIREHLYNKHPQEMPTRCNVDQFEDKSIVFTMDCLPDFDAKFFGISENQAHSMDPALRLAHEVVYEAIVDSGFSVSEIQKYKVGVYYGTCQLDHIQVLIMGMGSLLMDDKLIRNNLIASYANRISYAFGFKGPSFTSDSGCAAFMTGFAKAFEDIKLGRCDSAIIVGSHVQIVAFTKTTRLFLQYNVHFMRPFDADSKGFNVAEGIGALLLQRADKARRIYATVKSVHRANCGYNDQGIYHVKADLQKDFLQSFYEETKLDPLAVNFMEMHGTATDVGDVSETVAVADVFCRGRKSPLYIGSVKSNFGHSEGLSGHTSILKVIMAMESNIIGPNISFDTPNPNLQKIIDGTLKVATEPTEWDGRAAGVDNFGIGGEMVHMYLMHNQLSKKMSKPSDLRYTRLVLHSSPTAEGLTALFEYLKENPKEGEFCSLLDNIAFTSISHPFRGYIKLNSSKSSYSIQKVKSKKRPVWYICSSMGCQWAGMGLDLLKFDIFSNSVKKSADILKPLGINLFQILTPSSDAFVKNRCITPCFVAITAIQIGLIDMLKALGLEPDGIIGHSTGEMACAYADGSCTAEETILLSYYRGKAVDSGKLAYGKMAALGLSWEEAVNRCPKDIYPVAHNSIDLVTVSGLTQNMSKFLQELKAENIFTHTVRCCGYAFHCPYIAPAAPQLLEYLEKVLTNPRKMTSRWINTPYSNEERKTLKNRVADASYFVNNFVSPVHFYGAIAEIPKDSIIIEIGPASMFQTTLRKVVGPDADLLTTMKESVDNVDHFLDTIGRLYTLGVDPRIGNIYPPAKFPVPKNTPSIANFIRWDHSKKFKVAYHAMKSVKVDIFTPAAQYLSDHKVRGKIFFPATGFLVAVWQVLADSFNQPISKTPVIFEDVRLLQAVILSKAGQKKIYVQIMQDTGKFEIYEEENLCVTGHVYSPLNVGEFSEVPRYVRKDITKAILGQDMYDLLRIKGYEYGQEFQCFLESNIEGTQGLLKWEKWVTYLDALLIAYGISLKKKHAALPVGLHLVRINPIVLHDYINKNDCNEKGVPYIMNKELGIIRAPGVELTGLHLHPTTDSPMQDNPTHEEHHFVPYIEDVSVIQKDVLSAYNDLCIKEAQSMLKLSGKEVDAIKQDENVTCSVLDTITEQSKVLLTTLQAVTEHLKSGMTPELLKLVFFNYLKKLNNDVLITGALTDDTIRSVFDVIEENMPTQSFTAIEICDSVFPLSFRIASALKTTSLKNWSFTVGHKSPMLVLPELSSENVSVLHTKHMSQIESKRKEVLICSCFHGEEDAIHSFVNQIVSVHAEGFFVVLYREQISEAEIALQTVCDYFLEVQPVSVFESILQEENLCIIAKKTLCEGNHLYLLRYCAPETSRIICNMNGPFDSWIPTVKQALVDISEKENINTTVWMIAEKDIFSGVLGFMNSLKSEENGDKVRFIFDYNQSSLPPFDENDPFYADVLVRSVFSNVYKDGQWGSYRHGVIDNKPPVKDSEFIHISINELSNLSSLQWRHSPAPYLKKRSTGYFKHTKAVVCYPYYAALNFRDVVFATGRVLDDRATNFGQACDIGLEFSGRDENGNRIFGFCEMAVASQAYSTATAVWPVPDHWSLEQASTVLSIYTSNYYALIMRGGLKEGESILIHCGTGGIGQSAIHIASSLNCQIFVTVGSKDKREFLLSKFPTLKPENIGCSRDNTFFDMIMDVTQGKGVNVVINSLTEDKLRTGIRCLAAHGRFVEIGKFDLFINSIFDFELLLENRSFHSAHLDKLDPQKNGEELTQLRDLLREGITNNVVKPLNTTVFDSDNVEEAFRYLSSGKHMGKVVIKIRDEEEEKIIVPKPLIKPAMSSTFFYSHKSYIVIGGLGGFGLALTSWMVDRGAEKIILTSRRGITQGYQENLIKLWNNDIQIVVSKLNVAIMDECKELIALAESMGPVGGIFNSGLVLKDAIFKNQTVKNFYEVSAPKSDATKNLDALTRTKCPELDLFVCFSSLSCGRGMPSQTNYAYANSVMERICEKRKRDGLHGLAIQWGIIGDVGIVHRNKLDFFTDTIVAQRIQSCLSSLDALIQQDRPVVSSYLRGSDVAKEEIDVDKISAQLFKYLGVKDEPESYTKKLSEFGMDSLAGIETRSVIERLTNVSISTNTLKDMTVQELKDFLQSVKERGSSKKISQVNPAEIFNRISVIKMNTESVGTPVFFAFPGNSAADLKLLAEMLETPVYGLQISDQVPITNVEEITDYYLQEISKIAPEGAIYLAGYSSCSPIAFELAVKAKTNLPKSQVKVVFTIDGFTWLDRMAGNASDSSFDLQMEECNVINDMVTQCLGDDIPELKELLALSTKEQRLEYVTGIIFDLYSDRGLERSIIYEALQRDCNYLKLMKEYTTNSNLPQSIVLLESKENVDLISKDTMKSTLGKICNGDVDIFTIETYSASMVDVSNCTDIAHIMGPIIKA